jgi:hypothetical protein
MIPHQNMSVLEHSAFNSIPRENQELTSFADPMATIGLASAVQTSTPHDLRGGSLLEKLRLGSMCEGY